MGSKVLGLEIVPGAIKAALVKNARHPELLSLNILKHTTGSGDNYSAIESENDIASVIFSVKELTESNRRMFRGVDSVSLCVNNPQTVVRPIRLPNLPDNELNAAVEYELSQSFPGLVKTHAISFKQYTKTKTERTGIVSFSPVKSLESYRRLLEGLDYKHSYIDVTPNSHAKAYAAFGNGGETVLLCDINCKNTHLTIVQGNRVLHSRQISDGVSSVKDVFHHTLGMKSIDCENSSLEELAKANIPQNELDSVCRVVYSGIVDQIMQTVEFYNSNNAGKTTVAEVVLSGNGSFFPKLDEFFASALGMSATLLTPDPRLKVDRIAFSRSFSAIGAAIRGE